MVERDRATDTERSLMVFKYDIPTSPEVSERLDRLVYDTPEEGFTGFVQGQPASTLEERFARALDKIDIIFRYFFQFVVPTPFQIPGQSNVIDFMVVAAAWYPIEIDGDFAHKSGEVRAKDKLRDAMLDDEMRDRYPGVVPIVRIPEHELTTQEDADQIAREIIYA